ncbi:MAG TPA: hypothetical protein VK737_00535 [Opitutales bacterium]|jgi:hypothetical protein|nr:hypothetical protein [Opitutales bacterium]
MKPLRVAILLTSSFLLAGPPAIAADAPAPAADTASILSIQNDRITVTVSYISAVKGADGIFKSEVRHFAVTDSYGITSLDAVKLVGLGKLLTYNAVLRVYTQRDGDASPPKEVKVNVGKLQAGNVKDAVMAPGKNSLNDITITYIPFQFEGGTPIQFLDAIRDHYGVDWDNVQIPPELQNARVPAFRESNDPEDFNAASDCPVLAIVQLYNSIANHMPGIGHWDFNGDIYHPSIAFLVPDAKAAASPTKAIKVKALPLEAFADSDGKKLDEAKIGSLLKDIDATAAQATKVTAGTVADLTGNVSVQSDSRILVVIGTQSYLDLVESVIAAHLENQRLNLEHQLHAAGLEPPPAK